VAKNDQPDGRCPVGVENTTKIVGLEHWMQTVALDVKDGFIEANRRIDAWTQKLSSRLPTWATLLFMAMSAVISALVTLLAAKMKGGN